ncbi:serine hydrolase domain-containing protein [Maribacter halichondriae]|uniref:serine hydrolase domain-containing protein n=1 Tax=Maribacter halichondriae TaxID=2980554 RepID=UPI00235A2211|nr:serine hydrolase domain-containing protein [Maribacter sp. Hal144]
MQKFSLALSLLILLFVSCQSQPAVPYKYQVPENINDGLDVGTLDEVGIDTTLIVKGINKIRQGSFDEVHSMLVYKDGKLVLEEYFDGHKYKWDGPDHHGEWVAWDRSMPHHIMSATKSITSACLAIALEKGFIESVHQSIFDYLPEYQHLNSERKNKITIEHLLTMTSGLEWDEWGAPLSSSSNDLVGLWVHCEDPINCILERPLLDDPGTSYTYSGGNMVVLGEIIRTATKMKIDEFSKKYLFEPLGVDSSTWAQKFDNGVIYAGGGLIITPRDMVKFGVTFLNNGDWNGKHIISEQWVEKCTTEYRNNKSINIPGQASGRHGYSYSWWLKSYTNSGKKINMYNAGGWGGQEIMILPELNTVVVFTGGNYLSNVRVFDILEDYIIPAIN